MQRGSFNLRVFLLIAGCAVIGAATAAAAYASAGSHDVRNSEVVRALVWTVFGTPFITFWGWLLARRNRGWQAAFWCFMIYFFSIFTAARIERLLQGADIATRNGHRLYFQLTIGLNLLAAFVAALQEARTRGTMQPTLSNGPQEEQVDGAGAS